MTENNGNGQHAHGPVNGEDNDASPRDVEKNDAGPRDVGKNEAGDAGKKAAGHGDAGYRDAGQKGRDRREAGPARDPLGSIADEAMKLFDTLQRRVGREVGKGVGRGFVEGGVSGLGQAFGRGRAAASGDVWSEAVAGHHESDEYICRACPICRAKAAGREAGGDVTDHLVAAGGELVAAVRQAVDSLQRPRPPEPPRHPRDTRVEHIDLG